MSTNSLCKYLGLPMAALLCLAAAVQAATPEQEAAEAAGLPLPKAAPSSTSTSPARGLWRPGSDVTAAAADGIPAGGVLLIPESTNDRIMAFDPQTGDLIDADFVPADPANLTTPIHAILSADGQQILVSDQLNDAVLAYDLQGNFAGRFAPASGVDTSILDNARGISLRPNGNLLVTVGSGGNADAVAEFDGDGNYLGNFIAAGAGGLDSPFDVIATDGGYLVGGITSDAVHRYDSNGAYLGDLASINTFPEQLALAGNGNVLVANFSGTQEGILEFTAAGAPVGTYNSAAETGGGFRGVYELPGGNLLITNGNGVYEIDRTGALIDTKISGVSARFIQLVSRPAPSDIPTLSATALALAALLLLLAASRALPQVQRRTA